MDEWGELRLALALAVSALVLGMIVGMAWLGARQGRAELEREARRLTDEEDAR